MTKLDKDAVLLEEMINTRDAMYKCLEEIKALRDRIYTSLDDYNENIKDRKDN